jgi:hypothetical protein
MIARLSKQAISIYYVIIDCGVRLNATEQGEQKKTFKIN